MKKNTNTTQNDKMKKLLTDVSTALKKKKVSDKLVDRVKEMEMEIKANKPINNPNAIAVEIVEYDDSVQRVDDKDTRFFNTKKEALDFIADYNKSNNEPTTPRWYMVARLA